MHCYVTSNVTPVMLSLKQNGSTPEKGFGNSEADCVSSLSALFFGKTARSPPHGAVVGGVEAEHEGDEDAGHDGLGLIPLLVATHHHAPDRPKSLDPPRPRPCGRARRRACCRCVCCAHARAHIIDEGSRRTAETNA